MPGQSDFIGRWQLTRRIDDQFSGQIGQFDGVADFSPQGADGLTYHETGQMAYGAGPRMLAERRYQWRFDEDGVEVFFADGRPFHGFHTDRVTDRARHLCGADLYRVSYDFAAFPDWTATWTVEGPRKLYTSISRYCRG